MMTITRRTLFAALAALPFVSRLGAWAAEAIGTVVAVVNGATSNAPAKPAQPMRNDEPVYPGAEIHTSSKSAVQIALTDGSVVTIGAGGGVIFGGDEGGVLLQAGSLRFRTGAGAPAEPKLATPTLAVNLHQTAEMIVTVGAAGATTCGVVKGRITCTSKKKGTAIEVAEGQSVHWEAGAFGGGVLDVAYVSGDVAVDDGMAAAAAAWGNATPPMAK